MRYLMVASLLVGCGSDLNLGNGNGIAEPPVPTDMPGTMAPVPGPDGPSPLRDTDGDGIPDDVDPDIDGDGLDNPNDPDPDGDGQPGYTLPYDPANDPPIDPVNGLPVLEVGSARGRVCAPNGSTWVAEADVLVITPDGGFEAVSNGDGWWQVDNLPAGTWDVIITKGSFSLTYPVTILDGQVTTEVFDECLNQGNLSIGVVGGEWDSIENVLTDLGLQYDYIDGNITDGFPADQAVRNLLTNPTALASYDVLFLNCGISEEWVNTDRSAVAQSLSDYVNAGGSIYASDWSYFAIEAAFPTKVDFRGDDLDPGPARVGQQGITQGIVVDPAMASLLGTNIAPINFDLNEWVVMDLVDPTVETLVSSDQNASLTGPGPDHPLSVRFYEGSGRVIYTSFHNESAATPEMVQMLEEIVLSL